jgi:hypothetical protein
MHDLFIALAFLVMLTAPCIIASRGAASAEENA